MKAAFAGVLLGSLALAGGDFAAGARAYEQGRFREALEAFAAAERAEGAGASPQLLGNKALAALRAGDLAAAESAAKAAAERGGASFAGFRDFVLANVAFARCERAAAQAVMPQAEPFAFDAAIALAEKARASWRLAAASRGDWPAARRNEQRAARKIEELRRMKEEAQKKLAEGGKAAGVIVLQPDLPKTETKPGETPVAVEAQKEELSPQALSRLFDRLKEKEEEKRKLRASARQSRRNAVEKDW